MIMANPITTLPPTEAAWRPDTTALAPEQVLADSLILKVTTKIGVVEGDEPVVRCAYVVDAPAGFVAEGAPISDAQPTLSEVAIGTGKVAQLIKVSREQASQPYNGELQRSVER